MRSLKPEASGVGLCCVCEVLAKVVEMYTILYYTILLVCG